MKILFYFPFAGGTSYSVSNWRKYLPDDIVFVPLDIPGRGKRHKEEYPVSYNDLVMDFLAIIRTYVVEKDCEYIIFGHSLGGYVAYHLSVVIERLGLKKPLYIILSAAVAINKVKMLDITKRFKNSPDKELERYIYSIQEIPQLVLNNKKVMGLLKKSLQEDLNLIDTVEFDELKIIEEIQCIIFFANEDELEFENIMEWKNFFKKIIDIKEFQGNHFYLFKHSRNIVSYIVNLFAAKEQINM